MRINRVVVLFDDDELQELLSLAGDVPLSVYLRNRVIAPKYNAKALKALEKAMPFEPISPARVDTKPKSGLAADLLADIRESIEAHKAAPVDMKKLLP